MRTVVASVLQSMQIAQPEYIRELPTPPEFGKEPTRLIVRDLNSVLEGAADVLSNDASPSALGTRLVAEEVGEVFLALSKGDLNALADGIGDAIWVLTVLAVTHGIDMGPVFEAIASTNLAKFPQCAACEGSGRSKESTESALRHPGTGQPGIEHNAICSVCEGKGRTVIRDAGGKYQKPPGWTPPDIAMILATQLPLKRDAS